MAKDSTKPAAPKVHKPTADAHFELNRRILATASLTCMAIGLAVVLLQAAGGRPLGQADAVWRVRLVLPGIAALAMLPMWFAARRGRLSFALAYFVCTLFAVALIFSVSSGLGIHAQGLTLLVPAIVMSGLVAGSRPAWMVTLAAATTVILLWSAEHFWGAFPAGARDVSVPAIVRLANYLAIYISCGWLVARYAALHTDALAGLERALEHSAATLATLGATQVELERREAFARTIANAVPGGVAYWSADLRCQFANQGYQKYLGLDPGDVLGRHFDEVLPPALRARIAPLQARALAGETLEFNTQGEYPDGRAWHVHVRYIPDIQDGVVQGYYAFSWDITELAMAQRALEQANADLAERTRQAEAASQAKSRFLATMSHEIRTPLNAVLGMAQLLQMPGLAETERIEFARTITDSGQALLALLNEILDLAKIEAGKCELDLAPLAPGPLLDQVVGLHRAAANAKGLAIETACAAGACGTYLGDSARLRQMLGNLLSNAIKFTPLGGIRLELRELHRDESIAWLEFAVSDTGIGIATEDLERLFKPFTQLDDSNTRRFGGSGLGLSIVAQLATLMGGSVHVESTLNKGSRFSFRVPLKLVNAVGAMPVAATPTALRTAPPMARDKPTVLVAEDQQINYTVIEAMLKQAGLVCVWARDGAEVVEAVRSGLRPDYILMDCAMPVLDGLDATRQIRAWECEHGQARTPIIAVSAAAFEADRGQALAAGMDDFLAKPLDYQALADCLTKHRRAG